MSKRKSLSYPYRNLSYRGYYPLGWYVVRQSNSNRIGLVERVTKNWYYYVRFGDNLVERVKHCDLASATRDQVRSVIGAWNKHDSRP